MEYQWDHVPDAAELAEVYRKQLDEQAKRIAELEGELSRLGTSYAKTIEYADRGDCTNDDLQKENAELQAEVERLQRELTAYELELQRRMNFVYGGGEVR